MSQNWLAQYLGSAHVSLKIHEHLWSPDSRKETPGVDRDREKWDRPEDSPSGFSWLGGNHLAFIWF